MEVRFQGTYDRREVLAFDTAIRKAFGISGLYPILILGAIAALIGVPLFVVAIVRGDEQASLQWFLLGGAGLVFALRNWWVISRGVKKNPRFGQQVTGFLNDDGFEIETPKSATKRSWDGIAFMQRTRHFLVLVGETAETFGFSRAFFDSDQSFENACALAAAHVKGKTPARVSVTRTIITWIVVLVFIILVWMLYHPSQ